VDQQLVTGRERHVDDLESLLAHDCPTRTASVLMQALGLSPLHAPIKSVDSHSAAGLM
jgi:hypothetical protein